MAESVIKDVLSSKLDANKYHYFQGNSNNLRWDLTSRDGQSIQLAETSGLYLLGLYPKSSGFCGVTLSQSDTLVYYAHSDDGTAITLLIWLNTSSYTIKTYGTSNIDSIYLYQ